MPGQGRRDKPYVLINSLESPVTVKSMAGVSPFCLGHCDWRPMCCLGCAKRRAKNRPMSRSHSSMTIMRGAKRVVVHRGFGGAKLMMQINKNERQS